VRPGAGSKPAIFAARISSTACGATINAALKSLVGISIIINPFSVYRW
jgi:hypothetical protein